MQIQHEGTTIRCRIDTAVTPDHGCAYNTDGSEARAQGGGITVSSKTKWEGRNLLINSIVSGSKNYTRMDRWTLSRDGNTLRVRREIAGANGGIESILVYQREGVVSAAVPANEKLAVPANEEALPRRTTVRGSEPEVEKATFVVETGTKIPLKLINSVSTKSSAEGDRIYLETAFPILREGRIVIPAGSYVTGSVTQVVRPGRVKGRGEIYIRFDNLTLANGVTRDFRSRPGGMDGDVAGKLDRDEGRIRGEGSKGQDAKKVGEVAAAGASVGAIAGSIAGHPGMGVGIGAASGAAAGLAGILLSRGPDTVLAKGTVFEMVLDRNLQFEAKEIDFSKR